LAQGIQTSTDQRTRVCNRNHDDKGGGHPDDVGL